MCLKSRTVPFRSSQYKACLDSPLVFPRVCTVTFFFFFRSRFILYRGASSLCTGRACTAKTFWPRESEREREREMYLSKNTAWLVQTPGSKIALRGASACTHCQRKRQSSAHFNKKKTAGRFVLKLACAFFCPPFPTFPREAGELLFHLRPRVVVERHPRVPLAALGR